MNLENIKRNDMDVYNIIEGELARQRNTLELIASENFTSKYFYVIFQVHNIQYPWFLNI